MATTKTHKDFYNDIIELAQANDRDDIVAFAQGRILALTKKSAKASAKVDEQREIILSILMDLLADGSKKNIATLMSEDSLLGTLTNQKISSMLTILVNEGKVAKKKEKKIMFYYRPDVYVEAEADNEE